MTHTYAKLALLLVVMSFSAWTFIESNREVSTEVPICEELKTPQTSETLNSAELINDEAYYYDIGTRFRPIKHSKLNEALNFYQLVLDDELPDLNHLKSLKLMRIVNEAWDIHQVRGESIAFNEDQLAFLGQLEYSDNFVVRADYESYNQIGQLISDLYTPHFTVVPKQQARYIPGKEKLLAIIRQQNASYTANLRQEQIGSGKMYFTISPDGEVENIHLNSYKSIPAIDINLGNILRKLPGKWEAARNAKGEKVAQELVLSYGTPGC